MSEFLLNGIVEEEVTRYYHVCCYTDKDGPDTENPDNYIFIPKPVCRVVDEMTIAVLDWYVKKKKLFPYVRGRRRNPILSRESIAGNSQQKIFRKPIGHVRRD